MLGFGAWVIGVPLILYALLGTVFGRRQRRSPQQAGEAHPARSGRWLGVRVLAGAALVGLSAVAAGQGGRFSVAVLAGAGLTLLAWGRLSRMLPSYVSPVEESVLLRSSLLPLVWFFVTEVKLLTRNVSAALASVDRTTMIVTSDRTAVYVVDRVIAPTHSMAAGKATERLRALAAVLLPEGAYVVPLDSGDAAAVLGTSVKAVRVGGRDWRRDLQAAPYDMAVLDPKEGFVRSIGLYRSDGGSKVRPRVAVAQKRLRREPLLWEVLKALEARVPWPGPDEVAGYVAALGAKRAETLSQRIGEGSAGPDQVVVRMFAGRQVQLRPAQLRALVQVYG